MVDPINLSCSGSLVASHPSETPAMCEEVTEHEFQQRAGTAPIAYTDEYEVADANVGVVSAEIGDCITLFGISRKLDKTFAYHINGFNGGRVAQKKMVLEMFDEVFLKLDEPNSYQGVQLDLFLVGGTDAPHSQQLGEVLEEVMSLFFDINCCELDNSLLNPDRKGYKFITAYLSSEGKIYWYFHND